MDGELLLMEEILHQLIGSLSHSLQGFIHVRWCRISSINSMTQDVWMIPRMQHSKMQLKGVVAWLAWLVISL